MKTSRKLMYVIGAVFFLAMSVGTSYASSWCENATVTQTGVNPYSGQISPQASEYVVYLTCEDTTGGWATERRFVILDDASKESNYATALTALSTGNSARVLLMGTSENSLIEIIYVKNN